MADIDEDDASEEVKKDNTILWVVGGLVVYFSLQLWILPKVGVAT